MAWEMRYRVEIRNAAAGIPAGTLLVAINADYSKKVGLNKAVSDAMAFVRRFQSAGIDAEAVVFGKPVGADEAGTANPLDAAQQAEQTYATVDTPGKGLLQRISAANTAAAAADLDPDVAPDIPGITTA